MILSTFSDKDVTLCTFPDIDKRLWTLSSKGVEMCIKSDRHCIISEICILMYYIRHCMYYIRHACIISDIHVLYLTCMYQLACGIPSESHFPAF